MVIHDIEKLSLAVVTDGKGIFAADKWGLGT